MGFGRRPVRCGRKRDVPVIAIAFGAGLVLALLGFLKLALFFAAGLLIYLGFTCR